MGRADAGPPVPRSFTFWTDPRHHAQWAIPANLDQRQKPVPLYVAKMDGKRVGHREAQGGPQLRTSAGKPACAYVSAAPASRGWG